MRNTPTQVQGIGLRLSILIAYMGLEDQQNYIMVFHDGHEEAASVQ